MPLNANERNQLRHFFSERFQHERSKLTDLHIAVLRSLPIYTHLPNWNQNSDDENRHVALLGANLHLPNSAFGLRSYGQHFLQIADEQEANLAKFLGIFEISATKFLVDFVFPKLAEMPAEIRDDVMLRCVRLLASLQTENHEFFDILCKTNFVPTPGGQLKAPNQISYFVLLSTIVY